MTSYIYFIQAGNDGPIKIGVTTSDPRRRMANLQTGCPSSVRMLGAIEGSASQEKQIHLLLAHWRLRGEWFSAHPVVIAAVRECLRIGGVITQDEAPAAAKYSHPLCAYRTQRGLSLDDLSELTGISNAGLSRIESGARRPTMKSVKLIHAATGILPKHLRPDIYALLYGSAA